MILGLTACAWPAIRGGEALLLPLGAGDAGPVRAFFAGQLGLVTAFLLYQLVYWNCLWKPEKDCGATA